MQSICLAHWEGFLSLLCERNNSHYQSSQVSQEIKQNVILESWGGGRTLLLNILHMNIWMYSRLGKIRIPGVTFAGFELNFFSSGKNFLPDPLLFISQSQSEVHWRLGDIVILNFILARYNPPSDREST